MSLVAKFATDRKAETEGIEVTFDNVTFFRLARMGRSNKRYQQIIDAAMKQHKVAIRNDALDSAVDEAITLDAFLKTVLLGWRGMKEPELFDTEEEVSYSYANGKKLIDALPELYRALIEQATSMSNFRAQEIEADTKA